MATAKNQSTSFFVVTYKDVKEDKFIECKARTIRDSSLGLSFISISDFVFSSGQSVVVDPGEEYLKKRLENVKSLHLSIYSIISIEEVGMSHEGLKFEKDRSNLVILNPHSEAPTPPKN